MTVCLTFALETQRQIEALGAASVRLTLMSVSAPDLPRSLLETAVRSAAGPFDTVGRLDDNSLGLFSLGASGADAGAGVEHRFVPRMQAVLGSLARRRDIGAVHFRALHRWASEVTDVADLFDSLLDAAAVPLTVPSVNPSLLSRSGHLPRRVATMLYPWHSPMARNQPGG